MTKEDKLIKEISSYALDLMSNWKPARNRQKAFILEYVANNFTNASRCAVKAGFSEKNARKVASNMLNGVGKYQHISPVIYKIEQEFDKRSAELSVASAIEIKQFLTAVMRGEINDIKLINTGAGRQEVIQIPADLLTRLVASDKLAKALGMYTKNVNAVVGGDIVFEFGEWEEE
ncbi:MAG: terminase small subunit [Gemella sp.]|nr:terminase small subunit [Gemella sp.]